VLIETSGLALPKPLVQAFNWPDDQEQLHRRRGGDCGGRPGRRLAASSPRTPIAVDAQRKADPNLDHESPLHELFEDQLVGGRPGDSQQDRPARRRAAKRRWKCCMREEIPPK
jgi:cobalamin biosynthesis protein CobW